MGVWSSGMILALGDDQENLVDILACERPWVQFPARPFLRSHWLWVLSYTGFVV